MAPLTDATTLALEHADMNTATACDDQVEADLAHGDSTGQPPHDRNDLGRTRADEQRRLRSPLSEQQGAADHRDGRDDAHLLDRCLQAREQADEGMRRTQLYRRRRTILP